jgi:hypothetical protein
VIKVVVLLRRTPAWTRQRLHSDRLVLITEEHEILG